MAIAHSTRYAYAEAASRVTQILRLWPASCAGQEIVDWRVEVNGKRIAYTAIDGFDNPSATHTLDGPVEALTIAVHGTVNSEDRSGVLGERDEALAPDYFLYSTRLTEADDSIRGLAEGIGAADDEVTRMHRLMAAVRERLDYIPRQTTAETTAIDAIKRGAGVCQDHAHVLASAARSLGFPARYVSGYLSAGDDGAAAASHAWAEIYLSNLGWVGFDASNRVCPDERYVRIASGRDYRDAAPVRGVRLGGADETMEVTVQVREARDSQ
ncbi:MAG: transglutaminase family protein [Lysobacteraceae bacterium]